MKGLHQDLHECLCSISDNVRPCRCMLSTPGCRPTFHKVIDELQALRKQL